MRTTFCIMLLLTIILQGCGRKGPLILSPLPAATPRSAPAPSTPAPSTPENSESKKQP